MFTPFEFCTQKSEQRFKDNFCHVVGKDPLIPLVTFHGPSNYAVHSAGHKDNYMESLFGVHACDVIPIAKIFTYSPVHNIIIYLQ